MSASLIVRFVTVHVLPSLSPVFAIFAQSSRIPTVRGKQLTAMHPKSNPNFDPNCTPTLTLRKGNSRGEAEANTTRKSKPKAKANATGAVSPLA